MHSAIFNPLFGPRRCIAVPMVFYRFTQRWLPRLRLKESIWLTLDTAGDYVAAATPKQEMERRGNQAPGPRKKKPAGVCTSTGPPLQAFFFDYAA